MNGTIPYECTSNITIENMVLTGFGASVGSVGPTESHPCVDNVTFRNIKMPGTGKGIYIKSNKSDCKGNVSSRITNIL
jgi:polygalacturonase